MKFRIKEIEILSNTYNDYFQFATLETELVNILNNSIESTAELDDLYVYILTAVNSSLLDSELWDYAKDNYNIDEFNYHQMLDDIVDLINDNINIVVEFYN